MEAHRLVPDDAVPASRKLKRDDAADLASQVRTVIVCKGKKVKIHEVNGEPSDEIVDDMLGPTGNLRAPTLKVGKTLLVGFNEEQYQNVLAG